MRSQVGVLGAMKKSLEQRLLAGVEYDTNGQGCWLWSGSIGWEGYGRLGYEGREYKAHRLAYEAWVGPIPAGLLVCHHCDMRCCIRPDHLFAGTHADNTADMVRKDRHGMAVLQIADIPVVRARLAAGETQASVARAYGVKHSVISLLARGERWRSIV